MERKDHAQIDFPLLIVTLLLVGIGVVMVYSASYYKLLVDGSGDTSSYFLSTVKFALMGTGVMSFVSFVHYKVYKRFTWPVGALALVLSVAVLFLGDDRNGAKRWLYFGSTSVMPSEFSKIAVILIVAWFTTRVGKRIREFPAFLLGVGLIMVFSLLTFLQPDFSTAFLIASVGLIMIYISGCNIFHLFLIFLAGIGASAMAILLEPYRLQRLIIFINHVVDRTYTFDDARRQIMYSIYAIGSGGLGGVGLGMGELKNLRLPEPYNDFIFSIISEELGFVGAVVLLMMYSYLIYRIFYIAMQCKDKYAFILTVGIGILISFSLVINVAVTLNLIPTTGIPLPFVSKGGSSLLMMMFLIGIVLNVSYHNNRNEAK